MEDSPLGFSARNTAPGHVLSLIPGLCQGITGLWDVKVRHCSAILERGTNPWFRIFPCIICRKLFFKIVFISPVVIQSYSLSWQV